MKILSVVLFIIAFVTGCFGWHPITQTLLGAEVPVSQVIVGIFLVIGSIWMVRVATLVWIDS